MTRFLIALTGLNLALGALLYLQHRKDVHLRAVTCLEIHDPQVFHDYRCIEAMRSAWGGRL